MKKITIALLLFAVMLPAAETSPNRGLAVLCTAALPGSGQIMLGNRTRGEAIMWLDAAIIATWTGLTMFATSREQDARLSAVRDAGADISMTDAAYYKALERYDNVEEYNEDIRREARSRFPDSAAGRQSYYESHYFDPAAGWDWQSDSARFSYWRTRKSARTATLNAGFAAGGLLLNRLISVIDCAFFAGDPASSRRVEAGAGRSPRSLEVRFRF